MVAQRVVEAALILLGTVCLFVLLSLVTFSASDPGWSNTGSGEAVHNLAGKAGAWSADLLLSFFGWVAYISPLVLAYLLVAMFSERKKLRNEWQLPAVRFSGLLLLLIMASSVCTLYVARDVGGFSSGSGGIIGELTTDLLLPAFNIVGATLIVVALLLLGITLVTGLSWFKLMDRIGLAAINGVNRTRVYLKHKRTELAARREADSNRKSREAVLEKQKIKEIIKPKIAPRIEPVVITKPEPSVRVKKERQGTLFSADRSDSLPRVDLLSSRDETQLEGFSKESLEKMSKMLEIKLADFGVEIVVESVLPGPVVTRFEIQPAAGIKVSKISGLSKDLARSLAVTSVRVVEVIPGKSFVGIEVPNENRKVVHLGEVLASQEFDQSKSPVSLALGHDISGIPVIADLAKMPHLLVAGTTGSGKSVGLNCMILSILFKSTPEEVRMIMVDPKMLELSVYEGIPHLLAPVITDMEKAANGLRWAVAEMERRYKLMMLLGVRDLAGFNKKVKTAADKGEPIPDPTAEPIVPTPGASGDEEQPEPEVLKQLPKIVLIIDEFADMMLIVGKKGVETLIMRIAQKARAAGIHLIIATQRPSVDVITGVIKANVPSRIGYQVSSKVDSRTILGQGGAEQLLGHGDMLYLPPGMGIPIRVHGALVEDDEVHRVVESWRQQGAPDYVDEITDGFEGAGEFDFDGGEGSGAGAGAESDALYDEAVAVVTRSRRASISYVQRSLGVGYNRAANLVEAMEAAGVVSSGDNGQARQVLAPPPPE
ncbi:MAG: DNA translocase FtsK 4TM domain-containing protein [Pseudomonadales bacterium]|nr:DNA translocase FtsK 4TM domain-containing protein [Pseudomonadales bacterium]